MLQAGASPNIGNPLARTPLHAAAENGRKWDMVKVVELLLDGGAEPNKEDHNGDTPLNVAVVHSHPRVVQLLLERGANPKKKD